MIIRTCNLSCKGCTTFSDLTYKDYVTWKTGKQWLLHWLDRIEINAVGVMGGEPLVNPEIRQWLLGLRNLLPQAQIRFVTNGILLEKNWDIIDLIDSIGNSVLKISYHKDDPLLDNTIDRIFHCYDWQPVNEFGIERWKNSNGTRFQIARPTKFIQTFKNTYKNMMPHNSNPVQAFDICVQKKCPLLYNGKLYKCGTVGLTPDLLARMDYPNYTHWKKFVDSGLSFDCNQESLKLFVDNFGKPHKLCAQCPTTNDISSFIDHKENVLYKGNFYPKTLV